MSAHGLRLLRGGWSGEPGRRIARGRRTRGVSHAVAAGLDRSEGRHLYGHDPVAYERGRPNYPERVWEVLDTRCRLSASSRVVEIGPGTGLVTRRLLSIGAAVTGVEPNTSMASHLRQTFGDDHLDVVVMPFEEAELAANAFDLAVAATSFHWVEPRLGVQQLRRVVKPGGWVAIWWMLFEDPTRPDRFSEAAERVLGVAPVSTAEPGRPPFQIDEIARRSDLHRAGFVEVTSELIRTNITMNAGQVRALYATLAVVLRRTPPEQARILDTFDTIVRDDFGGRLDRTFLTALYTARNP